MKKRLRKKLLAVPHHRLHPAPKAGSVPAPDRHAVPGGATLLDAVTETLGTADKATRWLHTPNRALGGRTPAEEAATPAGVEHVRQVLGRIAHGIFS